MYRDMRGPLRLIRFRLIDDMDLRVLQKLLHRQGANREVREKSLESGLRGVRTVIHRHELFSGTPTEGPW